MAEDHPKLDIQSARVAMKHIASLDLRTTSIEQLKSLLTPVFRGYTLTVPRFFPGLEVFRGRIMGTQSDGADTDFRPVTLSELSYPPQHLAHLGRANRSGHPLMYCSGAREPVFFETRPKPGDFVAVATWKTIDHIVLNNVGYTSNSFARLGSIRPVDPFWRRRNGSLDEADPHQDEITEFLSESFSQIVDSQNNYLYNLSIAVGEWMIDSDVIDGLIFPSVAMFAHADNIALKPHVADERLAFKRAEFIRVDAVRGTAFDISVLDTAIAASADGTIQWRGRRDLWVLRSPGEQLTVRVENGKWVARDPNGNLVEPE